MMTTVFLSGSRDIGTIDDKVRKRVDKMVENGLWIVIGDAGGADTAFQRYLDELGYRNVTVYCSGPSCRNNVGSWKTEHVTVENRIRGRAFYTAKDKTMARDTDYGFALWDGKSVGTINNVLEVLSGNKTIVVFHSPTGSFFNLKTAGDLNVLLENCSASHVAKIKKETCLDEYLGNQGEIHFTH